MDILLASGKINLVTDFFGSEFVRRDTIHLWYSKLFCSELFSYFFLAGFKDGYTLQEVWDSKPVLISDVTGKWWYGMVPVQKKENLCFRSSKQNLDLWFRHGISFVVKLSFRQFFICSAIFVA